MMDGPTDDPSKIILIEVIQKQNGEQLVIKLMGFYKKGNNNSTKFSNICTRSDADGLQMKSGVVDRALLLNSKKSATSIKLFVESSVYNK